MAIHHVEMQTLNARSLSLAHLLSEPGEVSR
jgi:hypothetical protein